MLNRAWVCNWKMEVSSFENMTLRLTCRGKRVSTCIYDFISGCSCDDQWYWWGRWFSLTMKHRSYSCSNKVGINENQIIFAKKRHMKTFKLKGLYKEITLMYPHITNLIVITGNRGRRMTQKEAQKWRGLF